MPKTKKIPLRQCIACRELKPKKEMLRIVKPGEGAVFLDFSCEADEAVYTAIEEEYFGKK